MKFQNIAFTLANLALAAQAATWKFNAVSVNNPSYTLGLKYENKIFKMKSTDFPVFTTTINSGKSTSYKYVVLNSSGKVVSEESFDRSYTSQVASINEVFNRKTKNVTINPLPQVFEPFYTKGTSEYKNYIDNQIYNVYAKCNESTYNDLKYNPFIDDIKNDGSSDCTVTFVTKTAVYKTTGKLQLIGHNSRLYRKLSWKIKLDKKILGRKTIKFRGNANDPTLMRDKISSELYRAVGVPTYSSAYSRLMINNDVYGLYVLVDSINDKWMAPILYGNDKARVGTYYKTYAGADLKYLGNKAKLYEDKWAYEIDDEDADAADTEAKGNKYYRIMHFTKLFNQWDSNYGNDQSAAAVKALESFFNLESLLRQMVIESLTFAYDNFWANSGNYALYYNPSEKRYQIIPYDFDGSFLGSLGSNRFDKNYTKNVNNCINWADKARLNKDTYFVGTLFKHTLIKDRYDQIMKNIINQLFNVSRVSPLIDSLSSLIEEDIAWNFNLIDKLDTHEAGLVNRFTLQNFKDNTNYKIVDYIESNEDDANFGLKKWIQLRGDQCQQYVKNVPAAIATTKKTTTTTKKTTTTIKKTTTTTVAKKITTKKNAKKTTTTKKTTTKTTTKISTATIKISTNNRCGPQYGRCRYKKDCCSSYGHCGKGDDFCGIGCQPKYGLCY